MIPYDDRLASFSVSPGSCASSQHRSVQQHCCKKGEGKEDAREKQESKERSVPPRRGARAAPRIPNRGGPATKGGHVRRVLRTTALVQGGARSEHGRVCMCRQPNQRSHMAGGGGGLGEGRVGECAFWK